MRLTVFQAEGEEKTCSRINIQPSCGKFTKEIYHIFSEAGLRIDI